MNSDLSLGKMLDKLNINTRYFDMGRRINELSQTILSEVEQLRIPYPTPYQRSMWLGLLLQDTQDCKNNTPPLVWFLQFPLDEQGLLIPAQRDEFLQHLGRKLKKNIKTNKEGGKLEHILEGSPRVFTPTQEAKSIFHAKAMLLCEQAASPFYSPVKHYLSALSENNTVAQNDWQTLGLQGFADFAARLHKKNQQALLAKALAKLPCEPLYAICCCIEHSEIDQQLTLAIIDLIDKTLSSKTPDATRVAALLRALSNSRAKKLRQQLLQRLLNSSLGNESELLIAIALRCWLDLQQPELTHLFLECLANNNQGQALFDKLFKDLIFIPQLRVFILSAIREPDCSNTLALALEQLLKQSKSKNA